MLDRTPPISSNNRELTALVQLLEEMGIITKEEIGDLLKQKIKENSRQETPEMKVWKNIMLELDCKMPRRIEDVYDALISYGMPLENLPTYVQEAYKAKKEARHKKPS